MEQYALIFKNIYGESLQKIVTLFGSKYWFRIIQAWVVPRLMLRKIVEIDFDLIHVTNNSLYDLWILKSLVKHSRKKILYTMHDPIPHSTSSFKRKLINSILLFQNKRILKFAGNNLFVLVHSVEPIPINLVRSNILYYPHPHSQVNFQVDDIFNLKESKKIKISFVGRIDRYKGIERFIKVMSTLDRVVLDKYFLTIAGKGNLDYNNAFEMNRLNRFLTEDEFDSIIKYSDILVLPYLDATASGVLSRVIPFKKRVIISNLPGLTTYCKYYDNHIVFKSDDHLAQVLIDESYYINGNTDFKIEDEKFAFIDDVLIKKMSLGNV
jgi:glycosyltransferase involved in cell wall biosynthesis